MEGLKAELRLYREKCEASVRVAFETLAHETELAILREEQRRAQPHGGDDEYEADSSLSEPVTPSSESSFPQSSQESDDSGVILYEDDDDEEEQLEIIEKIRKTLPPKRRLKRLRRYGEDEDDEDDDDGEDLDDGRDGDDAEAEFSWQLPRFIGWRRALTRKGKQIKSWKDLMAANTSEWFIKRYIDKLGMVRQRLGPENRNLSETQARWDWVLGQTMSGHKPKVLLRPGAIREACSLCTMSKMCTHDIDGGWPMGWMCAKLMKAWVDWCDVLASILNSPLDDRNNAHHLRELDKAMAAVMQAHADKASGKKH